MNADKYEYDAHEYAIDPLSRTLDILRLDVSIYHNAKVCGNWRISEHSLGSTCFHIATTGSLRLDVPGHFSGILNSGDLVIFPRELPHSMVSAVPLDGPQRHLDYRKAQDIDGTGLLCGEVRFQHRGSRFLLDALPPVFVLRCDPAGNWLKPILEMLIAENMRTGPASKAIFDKLAELLFTYALRQYLSDHPEKAGMLAVYGHAGLSRAIGAVQNRPDEAWTLDSMAKEAAMSRTTFSETFKLVSGWTAGQYLTWWRMQVAWSLLSSGESMAEAAGKVGYKSEAAFSRAFRKMFDIAAGKVRAGAPHLKSR